MSVGFIHLRVHGAYSLLEGMLHPEDIGALCRQHAMPAIGITDTNNMFGALEYASEISKQGIQPIIGLQLDVVDDTTAIAPAPVVLLAQNETGYKNLLALASAAFLSSARETSPCVHTTTLENHNAGLIILSGGHDGFINAPLANQQDNIALQRLQFLQRIAPTRLYNELQRHGYSSERVTEPWLIAQAQRLGIPLVATNNVFFEVQEDYEAHDALLCIADGTLVAQGDRRRIKPEHYFKSVAAMQELFADIPEATANSVTIAKRCAYIPKGYKPLLPRFPLPDNASEEVWLTTTAEAGLAQRIKENGVQDTAAYYARLAFEVDVIKRMGFAGYFLIVADFINWAKNNNIPVGPGRGSGAGSLVAWALRITDLDPIAFGLLFERFLNPDRVSMPDFDIDFCQDRRDEVIKYVMERYGSDRVAHIITFGKLQARAVLRDVGRVLEIPYGRVDKISKLIPNNPTSPVTLQQAIDGDPQLQAQRDEDPAISRMMDIGLKLEGLYRHASTHAAGVVISDRPLVEVTPLYRDPRSPILVTQFNMKYVEKVGLVKFDFLGLKTLTLLRKAETLIQQHTPNFSLHAIKFDNQATYQLLSRADTAGVFQLESAGMRDALRKLKPDRLDDIIAMVALYRPGPMDNIPRYIACKHGQEEPDYLHPCLEPILRETYGVMIYQEQVMQVAQALAGFNLAEADLLRRAMGKKIKAEMDAQREKFIAGAIATHQLTAERADYIFNLVDKFAGYGFNKSHAAAYALISYQTAYLKANFPLDFMAATLSLEINDTDKLAFFVQDLSKNNIAILPPDINASAVEFTVEGQAIRYALAAVKGVGGEAMRAMVTERERGGAFVSIGNWASRLPKTVVNKKIVEALSASGAFDKLEPNRAKIFNNADSIRRACQQENSHSLFGETHSQTLPLPETPAWSVLEKLQKEFDAIGFYLCEHPLRNFTPLLQQRQVTAYRDITTQLEKQKHTRITMAGVVINKKERTSARGSKFAFVQLSDPTGAFEITVFSELLLGNRDLLEPGQLLLLSLDVQAEGDSYRFITQSIQDLSKLNLAIPRTCVVRLDSAQALPSLRDYCVNASNRGTVPLVIELATAQGVVRLTLPHKLAWEPDSALKLRDLPGVVAVEEQLSA